ncbi:Homeobox-like_domain superfamily [Hexamita inflata]|uniref:Homeobox-like domain superfamily n=1 Tax=Hexamita inflata TaxID=28002 RepID=A0AA86URK3_9EUKA|nr:Homeobox-like domain superfamily [Hexamita inflata]
MKPVGNKQFNGFSVQVRSSQQSQTQTHIKKPWNDADVQKLKNLVREYELSGQRTDWEKISTILGQPSARCKEKYAHIVGNSWDVEIESLMVSQIRAALRAGDNNINFQVLEQRVNRPAGQIQARFNQVALNYFTEEDLAQMLAELDNQDSKKLKFKALEKITGFPAGICFQKFALEFKKIDFGADMAEKLKDENILEIQEQSRIRKCYLKYFLRQE